MDRTRILIVDDDENIAELISLYLEKECYDTKIAVTGEEALGMVETYDPSLILLDLMLPGIDGYEVCQRIRKTRNTPIIILSAKGEVFDKVLGLRIGADDYMVKPFDSNEMVARVQALLRRAKENEESDKAEKPSEPSDFNHIGEYVEYDNLIVNITNYTVTFEGKSIEMPPKELELLYFLASKPNQVFTREQLLSQLWGYDFMGDTRTVDVHIKRVREKLTSDNVYDWQLATVWRIGYKFEVKK